MESIPDIEGADQVVEWFGYWPSFHDAEVLSITLNRSTESQVAIHTWHMTSEVDSEGYFVLTKHAVVVFYFTGLMCDPSGEARNVFQQFNHQNVLSEARLNKISIDYGKGKIFDDYELALEGIFGVSGAIAAERARVELIPEPPPKAVC